MSKRTNVSAPTARGRAAAESAADGSTGPACCLALFAQLGAPKLFHALCDPTRLAILGDLVAAGEPRSVGAVGDSRPIDLSVVSRHLRVLHEAGVLEREKRGKEVLYSVAIRPLARTLRRLADARKKGKSDRSGK